MSDVEKPSVNFSKPVNYLVTNSAKVLTSIFYYPILLSYANFVEKEESWNRFSKSLEFEVEVEVVKSLDDYAEALSLFDYKNTRTFINDAITEMSASLLNHEDDFFKLHYPDLFTMAKKHGIPESNIQQLRNQLFSFFRLLNNDFTEMEKSYRKIEMISERSNDKVTNWRSGWFGIIVGGTIGSFIIPILGTVIGAIIGWFIVSNENEEKNEEKFDHAFSVYSEHVDRIITILGNNAKELYKIVEAFSERNINAEARGIYYELKKNGYNADQIMTEYFKHEVNSINSFLESKVEKDDIDSPTWNDTLTTVHNFIKSYSSGMNPRFATLPNSVNTEANSRSNSHSRQRTQRKGRFI